ncbi:protein kinase [Streptomyces sp. WMMC500]|uniref:serine/threonine-protein kinase n=1 Tax=Streptomyces sp. WMMC500 TaxID=3015154 RepID=UPI00248C8A1D|nr:serine/threonine-protein kinase [Streptomyces sp. WMMC500]WBB60829.1 protein kinase [Streptomyces sp. WMMC500]
MGDGTGAADGPGRLIAGRYRLLDRIGRGGMGTVWRAEDEVLGRHVALKKLHLAPHLEDAERATLFERTRREARSAARIAHPNVVVVHDVVDDEGLPCIVMEHVPAPALDEVLKKEGPLPAAEAVRIGIGMVAALRAAHAAGVFHRDVKPGNVLLGADGRVVLTDFGIAVVADTSTLTRTGELVGSVDFCAPERLRGADPAPASDLWALGATLYQAVHGRPPFRRATPIETAYAIAVDPLDQPPGDPALASLIAELLAKDPADRPPAPEVERRLRRLAGAPPGDTASDTDTAHVTDVTRVVDAPRVPDTRGFGPAYPAVAQTAPPAAGTGVPAAGHGHGGGRGRGRRTGVWAAVGVVVASLALGGTYLALHDQGGDPSGSARGDKPPASTEGTPEPEHAPVPEGYHLVREEQYGLAFPVPDGWTRKVLEEEGEGVAYIDPTGMAGLRVVALDYATTDPLQHWKDDEAKSIREGKLPGYRQLRMQGTTFRGMPAAIWEFTWQGRAREFRARDLGFGRPGEKEYAIYLSTPSADWERHEPVFEHVSAGLRLGPDAQRAG